MLTKKHYIQLAEAIAAVPVASSGAAKYKAQLLTNLFLTLYKDNPSFNGERFLAACGPCEPPPLRDPFESCPPLEVPEWAQ